MRPRAIFIFKPRVSDLISHMLSDENDGSDICDQAWCPLGAGAQSDVSCDKPLESPHSPLSRRRWVPDINISFEQVNCEQNEPTHITAIRPRVYVTRAKDSLRQEHLEVTKHADHL